MKGGLSLEMCAQCNVSRDFTPLLCNYPENHTSGGKKSVLDIKYIIHFSMKYFVLRK